MRSDTVMVQNMGRTEMIINTVVMFLGLIVCCLFVFAMYGVCTSLREIYKYFTGRRAKRGYKEGYRDGYGNGYIEAGGKGLMDEDGPVKIVPGGLK